VISCIGFGFLYHLPSLLNWSIYTALAILIKLQFVSTSINESKYPKRCLFSIAQELAEANRLKRLELLQNYLTIHSDAGNDPNNQSIEKDLEDQA